MLNGKIFIKSKLGVGTVVSIILPIAVIDNQK